MLAGLILGFQRIDIGDFRRGADTPLGLSLGLDLQGGSHLVYQASLTDPGTGRPVGVTPDQMDSLMRTIERRVNNSGLGEPIIQILGSDRLLIQLPGVDDPDRAKEIIGETARLEFKRREFNVARDVDEITDAEVLSITVGFMPLPEVESPDEAEATSEAAEEESAPQAAEGEPESDPAQESEEEATPQPAEEEPAVGPLVFKVEFTESGAESFQSIVDRIFESFVMSQAAIQAGDFGSRLPNSVELTLDGNEQQRFSVGVGSIQRIDEDENTFAILVPPDAAAQEPPTLEVAQARLGDSPTVQFTEIQGTVDEDTGLTGDDLSRAFPAQHTGSGVPIVNLEFNDRGTRIFGELTQDVIAKEQATGLRDQIAIFLDQEELISPQVEAVITSGTAIIQGRDFTVERVRDIALLLESGRLPIPIELIQERDVDAILGADSLAKSVVAGLIGLALVLLFMTLYYRLPGLVASVALVIYASLVLAIFKILPVTLTLSGVAAVILSIGMAVDANILIFERMKDEIRAGRTLLSSINFGFDRAWPAIRDGNVSTLITCAILFWFADQLGASIVQGFAATLAIGVAVSMFTAITVSRTLLRFVATTRLTRTIRIWLPSGGSEVPQQFLTDTAD